jgi:threonylcarbamoyladenosine tRNA methylthiotransferase CDKAL1
MNFVAGRTETADARPGRVFVETYGCAFNVSDGEVMTALLERDGFEIVKSADDADILIVNSCTVKDRTYLDLKKRIQKLSGTTDALATNSSSSSNSRVDRHPVVILAGCAPAVPSQGQEFAHVSQLGPNSIAAVTDVVRRSLAGEIVHVARAPHDGARLELPSRRRNPMVEIVPISKGCLGSCSFCQTVFARGRLRSFPEEQILHRIRQAVSEGVRHIWLTSQDCGAYGLDQGTNLPKLMRKIARIPGEFRVRIGMANPDLIKIFLNDFAAVLSDEKFYQFAHVPVQAGSDQVLRDMRRQYSTADFEGICDTLRGRLPEITIATDVIVGFPTETAEDFDSTVALMRSLAIPVMNRARFSPRPGTAAARLPLLPGREVARRSAELYAVAREISAGALDRQVGREVSAIPEERFEQPGTVLARTPQYVPVIVSGELAKPGESGSFPVLHVTIRSRSGFHLHGMESRRADFAEMRV